MRVLTLCVLFSVGMPAAGSRPRLLLQQPTLWADSIAVVYAGDLWKVPRAGGEARLAVSCARAAGSEEGMQRMKGESRRFMCEVCPWRKYAERKPRALLARLWRWHTGWCPAWKAYQRSPAGQAAPPGQPS